MNVNEVCKKALEKIVPTREEEKKISALCDEIIEEIKKHARARATPVTPTLEGSIPRNTWIKGIKDIDIFLAFPESFTREQLETEGLEIAKLAANSLGASYEEWYAEHPYLRIWVKGYRVDIVPCYHLTILSKIKSAVDRTPFHTKYMNNRLTPRLSNEVRLLKQFMQGIGVYGSDLKTRGFSGYLCEILILCYGSFLKLLRAASKWKPRVIIDLEGLAIKPEKFTEPMVVIDPVDVNRNVAAVVTEQRIHEFIVAAKAFLESPSLKFFFPPKKKPLEDEEIIEKIQERGTKFVCITFPSPRIVPDILWPQLEKALNHVSNVLKSYDFEILRGETWANSICCLLFELESGILPSVEKHLGPPIFVSKKNQKEFIDKWKKKERFAGPWIEHDRWVVEIKRRYQDVILLLEKELSMNYQSMLKSGYPKHVAKGLQEGKIYVDQGIVELCKDDEFRIFLSDYLTKKYGWLR